MFFSSNNARMINWHDPKGYEFGMAGWRVVSKMSAVTNITSLLSVI